MIDDPSETAILARSVPDSGGAWVVPAFQGLGTPFGETGARAMIGGLSRGTTRAHLARAFLEGLAHRVADAAESVWKACPRPAALRVDGGASANDVLLQMQADYLGMPVARSGGRDGAALGAAAMAGSALRLWKGNEGALAWTPERVFEPTTDQERRAEARATWRRRLNCCLSGLP